MELCRKWRQPLGNLPVLGPENGGSAQVLVPEHEAAPAQMNTGDSDSKVHWTRWLGLIAVFAAFVMVEAVANIGLLMDALPGGALAAFLLAVLVSVINVGGFGISAGLLLSWLHRHFGKTRRRLQQLAWVTWMALAFAFNLVAGRHREAYARVVEQIREAQTATVPATRDILPDVPFNLLAWEFQAMLFALLGMLLCALGFAKGFTFIQGQADRSETAEQRSPDEERGGQGEHTGSDGQSEATSPYFRRLFDEFSSLPQRYQGVLTNELRGAVANWYRALDQERRNVTTLLETLKGEQNRQACIDSVEHAFIVAHNSNYPDKIDIGSVEAHRLEKYAEPLTVTAADLQVLEAAAALVDEWRESGQASFDERIAEAHNEITTIWNNYKALVLGEPEKLVKSQDPVSLGLTRS